MPISRTMLVAFSPAIQARTKTASIAYFATARYICWVKIAEASLPIRKKELKIAAAAYCPIWRMGTTMSQVAFQKS